MKNTLPLGLVLLLGLAAATTSFAQEVSFGPGLTLGANDFVTDANDVSTLALSTSASNYENLGSLGLTGSGWVFNLASGTVVISNSPASWVKLSDPFVSYGYFFINTTGSTQNFSMQFTSDFAPVTQPSSNEVRATFGLSLTDGTADGTGVTASAVQTGTLKLVASGGAVLHSASADVTLTSGPESATDGGTASAHFKTPNFPTFDTGPGGGPYNQLVVDVSGTFSPGAILSVSGRVDAIPEPSSTALFLFSGLATILFRLRRTLAV